MQPVIFTAIFFLAGDANGDGAVDGLDEAILNNAIGTTIR